jgi:hypothetical protein
MTWSCNLDLLSKWMPLLTTLAREFHQPDLPRYADEKMLQINKEANCL